jgi:SAM-dependent methyltransferase
LESASQFHRDTEFFKGFYRAGKSDAEVLEATEMDWFGARALEAFLRHITGKEERVLEAGVGSGRFSVTLSGRFPHIRFTGMDIIPELAAHMRRGGRLRNRKNLDAVVGDITSMPFPDASFDVTFNQGVVEHTGGRHADAIREMARVTRPGGKVVVTVPNAYCFPHTFRRNFRKWFNLPPLTGDEPPYRHREMRRYFQEAGLTSLSIEGYYFMQSIVRLPTFSILNRNPFTLKAGYLVLSQGGMLAERLVIPLLDKLTGNRFSNRFGFEIMVSGVKSE